MSGHRSRYTNCTPEPATAVRAWYQMPDDSCIEVEVVRYDTGCDPYVFKLGTRERISPFAPQHLHYTNPCAPEDECCPDMETECWVLIENQWTYDNGGGDPALLPPGVDCGSITGPAGPDGRPLMNCPGDYEIISWIVNGNEQITTPVPFGGATVCGNGSGNGMHDLWAAALNTVDPTPSEWEADLQPGCAWLIRAVDPSYSRSYGQLVIQDQNDPARVWIMTPSNTEYLTYFTRVVIRMSDGTLQITWLDNDGNLVPEPEGNLLSCEAYQARMINAGDMSVSRDWEQVGCQLDDITGEVTGHVYIAESYDINGTVVGYEVVLVKKDGSVTRNYTGGWEPCPDPESAPVQYTAEIATPTGNVFTLGTASQDLYSVSIRHRSGTVLVNGVEMDPGEVISWDAGDDPNGHLFPDITIDATNGSARVVYQRGGYPQ